MLVVTYLQGCSFSPHLSCLISVLVSLSITYILTSQVVILCFAFLWSWKIFTFETPCLKSHSFCACNFS